MKIAGRSFEQACNAQALVDSETMPVADNRVTQS